MKARRSRLGIDFGTSTTVAALTDSDGRVRPLLFDASPLLPSAVFAASDSTLLVGVDAHRAAVADPGGYEANPKRCVDDGTVWLGERELPVVDLIAAALARVAAEAVRVLGRRPDDVVLTHPATWGQNRLAVLTAAAGQAGLDRLGLVAEPVAAAAYFTRTLGRPVPAGRCLLVYDLGAGTFDISVVRPTSGGFEVIAADGLPDVGGLDLDASVVRHARSLTAGAVNAWQRLDWPQTAADRRARQSLWDDARAVKEQLSRHASAELHLPLVDQLVHLTREEFEKAARPHLDRTVELTLRVLRTGGIPPEDVGAVFLVGGASRVPLATTLLHRALRIAPTVIDQPELVVAEGALHAPVTTRPPADSDSPLPAPFRPPAAPPVAAPAPIASPGPITSQAPPARPNQLAGPASGGWPAPDRSPAPEAGPDPFARLFAAGDPPRVDRRRPVRNLVAAIAVLLLALVLLQNQHWWRPADPGPNQVRTLTGHTEAVSGVAFDPDGETLTTVSADGTVRRWDTGRWQLIGTPLTDHTGAVNDVAFAPDGEMFATAGYDWAVRFWDPTGGEPVGQPMTRHRGMIFAVAFSPDGSILASAGADDVVRLWDVASQEPLGEPLSGHRGVILDIAFSPDGSLLASASLDGTVRLWDVASTEQVGDPIDAHRGAARAVAFDADGGVFATAGDDGTVRLWDRARRTPVGEPLTGPTKAIRAVAFHQDNGMLVAAGDDRTVFRWNLPDRKPIGKPLAGHTTRINDLAFSPDGRTLATAGDDRTIRLWSITD
nr:Hsp70 family protein [Micromonospora sp. DSM 115978]